MSYATYIMTKFEYCSFSVDSSNHKPGYNDVIPYKKSSDLICWNNTSQIVKGQKKGLELGP